MEEWRWGTDLACGVEEVPVLDNEGRILPPRGAHLLQVDLALAWGSTQEDKITSSTLLLNI